MASCHRASAPGWERTPGMLQQVMSPPISESTSGGRCPVEVTKPNTFSQFLSREENDEVWNSLGMNCCVPAGLYSDGPYAWGLITSFERLNSRIGPGAFMRLRSPLRLPPH